MKVNLQFFAEEQEIEVPAAEDIEVVDQPETEETAEQEEVQEETETEEQSEVTEEETAEETEGEHTVPLSALKAEREKWKKRIEEYKKHKGIVEKLSQYAGVDEETLAQQIEQIQVQQYTQQGLDPQLAQSIVQQQSKLSEYEQKLKKEQRDLEIQKLKENPIFNDIETYRDEIEDYADRKGVSLKEAYFAVRGEDIIQSQMTAIEQRILNNLQKKQKAKVDTSSNGEEKSKPKVKLTQAEIEIAQRAGMTPEEYYKAKTTTEIDI